MVLALASQHHATQLAAANWALRLVSLAGWLAVLKLPYPEARLAVVGTLALWASEVERRLAQQPAPRWPLSPTAPPSIIRYAGHENEQVGRTTFVGYEKSSSFGPVHTFRFWAFDGSVPRLERWHAQQLPVKE